MVNILYVNLLSITITGGLVFTIYFFRKHILKNFDAFIRQVALLVYLLGYICYFIGFRSGEEALGTHSSWLASSLRPLMASLEMFAFSNELLEVGEEMKRNMLYMTIFASTHFAAAIVSLAVAVNYLGVRLKSIYRWNKLKYCKQLKGDVEVFFGINEISLRVAYDIYKHHPNDTIIFVNAPERSKNEGMLGFTGIFNFFSLRREMMAEIDKFHAIVHQVQRPIQYMQGDNVIEQIGLKDLLNKTKEFMGFYFLYDEPLQNISKSLKLRGDNYFKNGKTDKAYIFCRATQGLINGGTAFESNSQYNVEVVLVDSAQLSIKSMMAMPKTINHVPQPHQYLAHPINYVDIDRSKGLVTSTFHFMVIGFGETGQEAFKFLYEHGNFAYPKDFQGKHVICHIVDPKAYQKRGFFEMRYPCLRKGSGLSSLNVEIEWHNNSAGDGHFWDMMHDIVDDLNYIVISTGSDNRDIAIAYDLCDFALRWRKQKLHNYGIFARSYHIENESRFTELTDVCNLASGENAVHVIGKMSDTYTHQFMWKNYLEHDAAMFSTAFSRAMTHPFDEVYNSNEKEAYELWWKRHCAARGDSKAFSYVMRQEYQEFSNAFQVYTKMRLLGLDDYESIEGQYNRKLLDDCKTLDDFLKLPFIDNLARGEHIRYIASHESIGYSPMSIENFERLGSDTVCDAERHQIISMIDWDLLNTIPSPLHFAELMPKNCKENPYRFFSKLIVYTSLAVGLHQDKQS